MARKKPLRKAQDTNIENIPVVNDSISGNTSTQNVFDFINSSSVNNPNPYVRPTGPVEEISPVVNENDLIMDDYNQQQANALRNQKIMEALMRHETTRGTNPNVVKKSTGWPVRKEGGQILSKFKSAARFDQPTFKNGGRTKG